jgi:hypothetical protein
MTYLLIKRKNLIEFDALLEWDDCGRPTGIPWLLLAYLAIIELPQVVTVGRNALQRTSGTSWITERLC